MLGVDHGKITLLSTPFPIIAILGTNCCCNVILFYVGNKRCCIVLRFAFLLHNWKDMLDYSDDTMQAAVSFEKLVNVSVR